MAVKKKYSAHYGTDWEFTQTRNSPGAQRITRILLQEIRDLLTAKLPMLPHYLTDGEGTWVRRDEVQAIHPDSGKKRLTFVRPKGLADLVVVYQTSREYRRAVTRIQAQLGVAK